MTIDDGPSRVTDERLDFLIANEIGAVLFCRGDYLEKRRSAAIRAISEGYVLGNHSYDHPHFSILTEEQVRIQITRTDEVINRCYAQAKTRRPVKYFRFPYRDPGVENNRVLLQKYGYSISDAYISVEDWKTDESNVERQLELAKHKLRKQLHSEAILGLHDHESNFRLGLFQRICNFVTELDFVFYNNRQLQEHTHSINL